MMLASAEHSQFTLPDLLSAKRETVTVCIPTRETAATIGATIGALAELRDAGLIDQLMVVDADSADGTAGLARAAGAEAFAESELVPERGPVRGKGDAMWRALAVARGEIVVYLDGDIRDFGAHYATGLLGPLLRPDLIEQGNGAGAASPDFVKGFYNRPLAVGEEEVEGGGGRVTELTAKPLLELLVPELAAFRQPLAGECAARRSLLMSIPYSTGYGVEIAMLVEVWKRIGIGRMAQVGLDSKRNSHQPLASLGRMSREVVEALVAQTADAPDPSLGSVRPAPEWAPQLELRPPMRTLIEQERRHAAAASEAIPQ
jgi:glucosyl-3-phosphoglycerate synthase